MKFTLEKIKEEHQKVKSGADFPHYIQTIKNWGVAHYTVYVKDGSTEYFDAADVSLIAGAKYEHLTVSTAVNLSRFTSRLQLHQKGGTDYMTFCNDCAQNGVEGWTVDLNQMTCSYFDRSGHVMLTEKIPFL